MIGLILAGGSGTRFWPLSKKNLPKQFLNLIGEETMIKQTYDRLLNYIKKENIYVITTHDQVPLIYDYLPEMNTSQVISEPIGMNTGPCIALAITNFLWNYTRDERILVVPSDHYIPETTKFIEFVKRADELAKNDYLITFGVKPRYPATGYGYIEIGNEIENDVFHVKQFKEKPNLNTAKEFLNTGNYLWNSGMFCFSIFSMINSFDKNNKEIFDKVVEVACIKDLKTKKSEYKKMPKIPIDIAIFEKADNVVVLPVDYIWSDIGNWSSLSDLMEKDINQNYNKNKTIFLNSTSNNVFTKKLTALVGVNNLIVVETDNEILICSKDEAESVKYVNYEL